MKTFFAGVAVAVVALLGGFYVGATHSATAPQVGAVSSPDIQGPYFSTNGLTFYSYHIAMTKNASTTCAMKSPGATSTLTEAGIKIASSSSSQIIVEMGQAVNGYSTTTLIGTTQTVAAGAQATILASTSPQTGAGFASITFAPNTYFNIKLTPGANYPSGTCDAMFMVI